MAKKTTKKSTKKQSTAKKGAAKPKINKPAVQSKKKNTAKKGKPVAPKPNGNNTGTIIAAVAIILIIALVVLLLSKPKGIASANNLDIIIDAENNFKIGIENGTGKIIVSDEQIDYLKALFKTNQIPLDMEELIEAIIDEKWAEVERDIGRIIEWKDSVDERIGSITAQVTDLKTNFEDLHKAILGKVGDYDKNILEVGTQLKAMEEVFSKVLPTFTDNVGELNRITNKLKGN